MPEKPSVCIMIPTYNQAGYIVKAVATALAQDYVNLEVIVADDHSVEDIRPLLQPFLSDKRVKYFRNPVNLGRVGNYKKCLTDYATADWVLNLDGDDYLTNNQFISQAMEAISVTGFTNTLFYQGIHIYKSDKEERILEPSIHGQQAILNGADYFNNFFQINYFSHLSTLYNRQLAIAHNFYSLDIISSDIYSFLSLCISEKNKCVIVSKNIAGVWYQHEANTSKSMNLIRHFKNFTLYIRLYKQAKRAGFKNGQTINWLLRAGYNYAVGFTHVIAGVFKK